ncbi:type III-A CRISPR-associated protein Csm2 [Syntrophobacter fumaroxidans]|uniref:CRISPR system Cms protein Csm2 n=1 Tax=Syntrophobacter fumaroxidans (strain DSM 10017 / MPOB) TaxID=335543 RepID=A0LHY7_SYNFM|nr:type III-A CRISPR-associated protein Csm2 [Syntrophobacter fumaroxidans]ABK17039.1 CRISPR-associated protein, Csm2 family [Syntrophobacter fumaroxidans MPOB]
MSQYSHSGYGRSGQGRYGQGSSRQGARGGQQGAVGEQLPTPTPVKYFTDEEKRKLDPSLVDARAASWASSFRDLKSTQMRRFYDEFKAIERKILRGKVEEQVANFERDMALVMMFKAKAVYAEKRKVSPREFTQFIFDHMASIKDLKDFQAFIKVFEAVVAFHRFYAKDN